MNTPPAPARQTNDPFPSITHPHVAGANKLGLLYAIDTSHESHLTYRTLETPSLIEYRSVHFSSLPSGNMLNKFAPPNLILPFPFPPLPLSSPTTSPSPSPLTHPTLPATPGFLFLVSTSRVYTVFCRKKQRGHRRERKEATIKWQDKNNVTDRCHDASPTPQKRICRNKKTQR